MASPPPAPHSVSEVNLGGHITADAVEFGRAMEKYQRRAGRRYPTWLEVLNIARDLGWSKHVIESNRDG